MSYNPCWTRVVSVCNTNNIKGNHKKYIFKLKHSFCFHLQVDNIKKKNPLLMNIQFQFNIIKQCSFIYKDLLHHYDRSSIFHL